MNRLLASTALPLFVIAATGLPLTARAQSVQDFQLPPNPAPSPSPSSTVQGPVDSETGPIQPRATDRAAQPTPVPTTRPTPAPTSTPAVSPVRRPTPAPTPALRLPSPVPSPAPSRIPAPRPQAVESPVPIAPPSPSPIPSPEGPPSTLPEDGLAPPTATETGPVLAGTPPPATPTEQPEDQGSSWWWIAALLAVAGAGAAFAWQRRGANRPVPRIEPPRVRGEEPAAAPPAPSAAPAAPVAPTAPPPEQPAPTPAPPFSDPVTGTPLSVRFEPLRLSRSVMAATLYYRATILNRGSAALNEVVLEADLGSASGARPVDQQVLDETTPLTPRQVFGRLATGQSARFEGSVQLPLAQADTIRQGDMALLVPLMRLRATAQGAAPLAKTFAVGQLSDNGSNRLQPFRLDEGLRSWEPLAQRQLERPVTATR